MDKLLFHLYSFRLNSGIQATANTINQVTYHCQFCDATWTVPSSSGTVEHERDPSHRERVSEANYAGTEFLRRAALASTLATDMRDHEIETTGLNYEVLRYLFSTAERCSSADLQAKVKQIKWGKTLALLELALWKAACILNPPEPLPHMTSVMFWISGGWKAQKVAMRHNEIITVVMENVIPFLEKPAASSVEQLFVANNRL